MWEFRPQHIWLQLDFAASTSIGWGTHFIHFYIRLLHLVESRAIHQRREMLILMFFTLHMRGVINLPLCEKSKSANVWYIFWGLPPQKKQCIVWVGHISWSPCMRRNPFQSLSKTLVPLCFHMLKFPTCSNSSHSSKLKPQKSEISKVWSLPMRWGLKWQIAEVKPASWQPFKGWRFYRCTVVKQLQVVVTFNYWAMKSTGPNGCLVFF